MSREHGRRGAAGESRPGGAPPTGWRRRSGWALCVLLGVAWATGANAAVRTVRVGVTGLMRPQHVELVPAGPCRLAAGGGGDAWEGRLKPAEPATADLDRRAGMLRLSTPAGSRLSREIVLDPGGGGVRVSLKNGFSRIFRGKMRLFPAPSGDFIQIVIERPLASYLEGVVQAETKGEIPGAALTALAVVAADYVRWRGSPHADEGFDFCDSTHCAFYAGEEEIAPAVRAAVSEGLPWSISARGDWAPVFSSCCGGECLPPSWVWPGRTAMPGSGPIVCPWCRRTPGLAWRLRIPEPQMARLAEELFGVSGLGDLTMTLSRDIGYRVALRGNRGAKSLPVEEFRIALGRRLGWNSLRGNRFSVSRRGGAYLFDGRGTGHCAGLCVAGAAEMARTGASWHKILNFYFPRASLVQKP